MALANYIGTGTYSIIEDVDFSSEDQNLGFNLLVHSDSSKSEVLASVEFNFLMNHSAKGLLAVDQETPPSEPDHGDSYLIAKTGATGDWANFPGYVAKWTVTGSDSGAWVYMDYSEGQVFYDEAISRYITITDNGGHYKTSVNAPDTRTWDAFFTKDHIFNTPGSNLHSQIYEFLKTQPGFESVIDA